MRRTTILAALLGTFVVGVHTASAAPLTAATILSDFNAVIYNDASTSADIEGAAVVGGNFTGATVYNNPPKLISLPAGYGALTVYGATGPSGSNLNLDNGGSAYVGGAQGQTITFNGGGAYITAPPPNEIGDFESALNALSGTLFGLAATTTLPAPQGSGKQNNVSISAGTTSGIAVLNVTSAELANIASFSVDLGSASTLVINVSGDPTVAFDANENGDPTANANKVIWNFADATSVSFSGGQLGGTVLAPNAAVSNVNQIDGFLAAASFDGRGELHDYSFTGELPSDPTPVPEPTSLLLLLAGLGVLAVYRTLGSSFRSSFS